MFVQYHIFYRSRLTNYFQYGQAGIIRNNYGGWGQILVPPACIIKQNELNS